MFGGRVTGIPKDAMDKILRSHMEKMAEMAAAVNKGETPDNVDKGTVIIIANHGERIDIPPGSVLENKIVSGNLRILDH